MTDIVRELIDLVRGDDWVLPFTEEDPDGNARDMTGCSVSGRIWWNDPVSGAETGFDATATITDALNGEWEMRVARDDTNQALVPVGTGAKWSGTVTDANDDKLTEFILPLRITVKG